MSYDLHVYARDALDHGTLVELAAQVGLAWRQALRRLVVDVAGRTDAVLVTAELLRGVSWSGRWLPSDLLARRPLLGEPASGPPGWRPARTRPDALR